jgi:hypothetical protein
MIHFKLDLTLEKHFYEKNSHRNTSKQWFSNSDFNAYRSLGLR